MSGGATVTDPAPTQPAGTFGEELLRVEHLVKHFPVLRGIIFKSKVGTVQAVDDVSLSIRQGETLGVVGESGCGKSTTARTVLRLLEPTSGAIYYNGQDIVKFNKDQMRRLRREMQIIFQDPFASLNPRMTVRSIVSEPLVIHGIYEKSGGAKYVADLLERVGLNPEHGNRYPHEFSGGQRQRIGVARALALKPKLIICDEPVSALDVSVQAQILNLLEDLQNEFGLTYMFIAHDLSVVRHISDRVAVMYLGKVVEQADRDTLYERPMHPYTQALISAVPIPDPQKERDRKRIILEGDLPSPLNPPPACRFHTRCWKAQQICRDVEPPLEDHGNGHLVACHFAEEAKVL
ncbi:MAG: ABC transporter ATP-binding protein [Actinomycetota bacterium]|nr:dipeptide ABC transporter ATP-binding protein [Actinomycetota bacterium]